ncbi:hypothetical protein [Pseudoalteromonas prydzensis]|uniref:hypothetical protein n=1 Tax=Pseudoalteromonas prydzensis TaxID=182141 RepID=UPI0007E51C30|nr:hypothetical protein [Pseudoalteromonas prydzensis]MBE0379192.1 hypothetical protein [Pseudoalteromonas prydzensis ACAM 620]
MGALVLGVVLILGYFYQSYHPYRRLRLVRSSGYHIYFKAGLSGLVFVLLATVTWLLIDFFDLPSNLVDGVEEKPKLTFIEQNISYWKEIKAVAIFLIALVFCSLNIFLCKLLSNKKKVYEELASIANDLEMLIVKSTIEVKPIRVELDCGKVYVGLPETPDFESGEIKYITLLPLLSGYVDDKKKIVFNNNYYLHYEEYFNEKSDEETEHNSINDFSIVIPVEEVVVASRFSIDAFIAFRNAKESVLIGPPNPKS